MTGRTAHDALLSVLVDAGLRRGLPPAELGAEEADVLARADPDRLRRLARFMARHFYRERLVRLFSHCCAVARRSGENPVSQVDAPELRALLDEAVLGSAESADAVASRFERWFVDAVPDGPAWWPDLVRYEGAFFRAEAARRVWSESGEIDLPRRPPRRSVSARVVDFAFDLPALLVRLDRLGPSEPLPVDLEPSPTRLLIATSRRGVVHVIRLNPSIDRFLSAIDGERDVAAIAESCGMTVDAAGTALQKLQDVGAVEA